MGGLAATRPSQPGRRKGSRPQLLPQSQPVQTTTSAYLYTTTYTTTTTTSTKPPVTFGFCKMIMYDETYFRGQSIEITGDVSDFNNDTLKFDDEVASLKIEDDCCWTLFTESNFQGVSMKLNV